MTQTTRNIANGHSAKTRGPASGRGIKHDAPTAIREVAESAVTQGRNNHERMKTNTAEAIGVVGKTYETAGSQAMAMTLKALEIGQANANASFAFFKGYLGVKNLSDAIELQSTFAKTQFAVLSGQAKDLQQSMQKAAVAVAEPAVDARWAVYGA
jgi:phasin